MWNSKLVLVLENIITIGIVDMENLCKKKLYTVQRLHTSLRNMQVSANFFVLQLASSDVGYF